MTDEPQRGPEDEFREMLRQFLAGGSDIDPSKLAGAAGLPSDPAFVARLMSQLQDAVSRSGDGIDWSVATQQATAVGTASAVAADPAATAALEQAFTLAALWLDEVTYVAELTVPPKLVSRAEWARLTMPVWTQLAEPVAESIADSLTRVLSEQAPDEMQSLLAGAGQVMRSVGGTLFALQLGQVVGQLSTEVVSGGDVGIPLLDDQQAAIVPQNVDAFGEGLDIERDQVQLYLAVGGGGGARAARGGAPPPPPPPPTPGCSGTHAGSASTSSRPSASSPRASASTRADSRSSRSTSTRSRPSSCRTPSRAER
jgi:hypothetical protein